jgi:hypothetical protein
MSSTDRGAVMSRGDTVGPDHRSGPAGPSGAPRPVATVNLGLRFGVELATFASLGYRGASVSGPMALRTLLAVGAPLVAVGAWARWLAPRAPRRLTGASGFAVELSIFAAATWGLVTSGMGRFGLIYGSLAVINAGLIRAMGQFAPETVAPAAGDREAC